LKNKGNLAGAALSPSLPFFLLSSLSLPLKAFCTAYEGTKRLCTSEITRKGGKEGRREGRRDGRKEGLESSLYPLL